MELAEKTHEGKKILITDNEMAKPIGWNVIQVNAVLRDNSHVMQTGEGTSIVSTMNRIKMLNSGQVQKVFNASHSILGKLASDYLKTPLVNICFGNIRVLNESEEEDITIMRSHLSIVATDQPIKWVEMTNKIILMEPNMCRPFTTVDSTTLAEYSQPMIVLNQHSVMLVGKINHKNVENALQWYNEQHQSISQLTIINTDLKKIKTQ